MAARKARRLDQHNLTVAQVINALKHGAVLHLSHAPRRHWRLSSGAFVPDDVARMVIAQPAVIGVGDALFDGSLSQTFRFVDGEENHG